MSFSSSAIVSVLPPLESFVEVLPVPPQQERRRGIVRFAGLTDFAEGEWVGVELVGSEGRNDGSVKGQSYFKCLPGQGVFVRPSLVIPFEGTAASEAKKEEDAQVEVELDALRARVSELDATLHAAQCDAEERTQTVADLNTKLSSLEAELVAARTTAEATAAAADDDELAAQVRFEEQLLTAQRQLDGREEALAAAQKALAEAVASHTAAEAAHAKAHETAQEQPEIPRTQELEKKLAETQAALVDAVADAAATHALCEQLQHQHTQQQQQQQQQRDKEKEEKEQLQAQQLQRESQQHAKPKEDALAHVAQLTDTLAQKEAERQQSRKELDDLKKSLAASTDAQSTQRARLVAAEARATVAEQQLSEVQKQQASEKANGATAYETALSEVRAELGAAKTSHEQLAQAHVEELHALRRELSEEREVALKRRDAAHEIALAAARHETADLQELCQLLEEELHAEKSQSDELAKLVEQLGTEKACAEAAIAAVEQQTLQERDRLRHEVAEARAREVRTMALAEEAQRDRDAARQEAMVACSRHVSEEREALLPSSRDASSSRYQSGERGRGAEERGSSTATTVPRVNSRSPSQTSSTRPLEPQALLEAALQKRQNELDEAQVRIMQLASAEQVAAALQRRCDELTRALQTQRTDAQEREHRLSTQGAVAQQQVAEKVARWERQCTSAQKQVTELSKKVRLLEEQLSSAPGSDVPFVYGFGNSSAGRYLARALCPALDAARETRYERQIASLVRQLLECQSARLSAVVSPLWAVAAAAPPPTAPLASPRVSPTRPLPTMLDFSSPEACKASMRLLFREA